VCRNRTSKNYRVRERKGERISAHKIVEEKNEMKQNPESKKLQK
jgi:hypothetical protein